jgi:calcineurin-like phosphoesterase family protein
MKVNLKNMANYFAISDYHFNHSLQAVLQKRGFKTAEEMNEGLIKVHNETVPKDGIVFNFGDYCLSDPEGETVKETLKRLNFKVMYIMKGNHPSGVNKLHRETVDARKDEMLKVIDHLCYMAGDEMTKSFRGRVNTLKKHIYPENEKVYYNVHQIKGKKIIFVEDLIEVFITGQQEIPEEERIPSFVMSHYALRNWHWNNKGSIMLCGHSHGNDKGIVESGNCGRILDCGWESIKKPMSLLDIYYMMKVRDVKTQESHR